MRLSLEIVPHSYEKIIDELELVTTKYNYFDTINIPDIKRLKTNCLEIVNIIKNSKKNLSIIPHIVAGNYQYDKVQELINNIIQLELTEILIVQGDHTEKNSFDTISLAQLLSEKLPQLNLYAAIDPYRQNIEQEIDYAKKKKAVGIKGFFTQPFFDLSLFQKYFSQLENENVFWGISPVITQNSYNYWVQRNKAIFSKNFEPSLDWNAQFYHKVKKNLEKTTSHHLYLMPIKINISNYLNHIFNYHYV